MSSCLGIALLPALSKKPGTPASTHSLPPAVRVGSRPGVVPAGGGLRNVATQRPPAPPERAILSTLPSGAGKLFPRAHFTASRPMQYHRAEAAASLALQGTGRWEGSRGLRAWCRQTTCGLWVLPALAQEPPGSTPGRPGPPSFTFLVSMSLERCNPYKHSQVQ